MIKYRRVIGLIGLLCLLVWGTSWLLSHQQLQRCERRVELLQAALEPGSPRQAVDNWAQAVKQRNGAWQYALLTPDLQKRYLPRFEKLNWVTGTSSPWAGNYEIERIGENSVRNVKYKVKFNWYTSAGYFGSSVAELWVTADKSKDRVWYIRKIKYSDTELPINTIAARTIMYF